MGLLTNHHYAHLDIWAEVERHTNTRLHPARSGKQANGACPYDDCPGDTDGFMVFPQLTPRGCHFHCRTCHRAGDLVKLLEEIKGLSFREACALLEIPLCASYSKSDTRNTSVGASVPKPKEPTEYERREADELLRRAAASAGSLRHERASAYLAQRGIALELAEACGLWYLPPVKQTAKWSDRIVFPLLTSDGQQTYSGRSLYLWQPGMDEHEHKQLLDDYNRRMRQEHGEAQSGAFLVHRWVYPYLNGLFNGRILASVDRLVLVEGAFDALALMTAGITNVVAMGGKALEARCIPMSICDVILGMDADAPGKEGATKLAKDLRRAGISVEMRVPVLGKDWSEAYRLHGREGIAPLLSAQYEGMADAGPTLSESDDLASACCLCGAEPWTLTEEHRAYCKACWRMQGHEPADDAKCCVCGDFVDVVDEDGRAWCAADYRKMLPPAESESEVVEPAVPGDESMTHEQFMNVVQQSVATLPQVEWTVERIDGDLDAYKQRMLAEYRQTLAQQEQGKRTQADYWSEVRRELMRAGYYEQAERERVKRQKRIETYKQWCSSPSVESA